MSTLVKIFAPLGIAAALTAPAQADGLDDFIRGLDALARGAQAIQDFDDAINGRSRGRYRSYGHSYEIRPWERCPSGYTRSISGNASPYTYINRSGRRVHYPRTFCSN